MRAALITLPIVSAYSARSEERLAALIYAEYASPYSPDSLDMSEPAVIDRFCVFNTSEHADGSPLNGLPPWPVSRHCRPGAHDQNQSGPDFGEFE